MLLTGDAIRNASDIRKELVPVPEWGGEVYVRTMRAGERDRFESDWEQRKRTGTVHENLRARVAVVCCCDEHGNRLFTDDDVSMLSEKSCAALDRIFAVAIRLNHLTNDAIAELEKN